MTVNAGSLRAIANTIANKAVLGVVTRLKDAKEALVAQISGRAGENRDDVVVIYPFGFDAHPVEADGSSGPEGVVLQIGGNSRVLLPPMDRRHRSCSGVDAADEAALYTTRARITLKANGTIEIRGRRAEMVLEEDLAIEAPGGTTLKTDALAIEAPGGTTLKTDTLAVEASGGTTLKTDTLAVEASGGTTLNTDDLKVTAPGGVVVETPDLKVSGNIQAGGDIGAKGSVSADRNVKAGGDVRDRAGTMAGMRDVYNGHTHPHPKGPTSPPTRSMG